MYYLFLQTARHNQLTLCYPVHGVRTAAHPHKCDKRKTSGRYIRGEAVATKIAQKR